MAHRWATRAVLGAGVVILLTLVGCEQGGGGIGSFFVQNYCDLECPYGFRTDAVGTPFCACAEQECVDRPPTRSYRPGPVEPEPYEDCYEVCDCNFFGMCDCYDECYDGQYYDDCEWAETEEEYEECLGVPQDSAPPPQQECQNQWMSDGECDGGNNTATCGYDGGDCCESTCTDGPDFACGVSGFDCRDPAAGGSDGGELPPEEIVDWSDGQCVAFASECDIPEGYIPCPGCSFQGRNLQPGDIAEISGARWLCLENGQVTMLPPLTNPEPSPEPEPDPEFCTFAGQTVTPGAYVNPDLTCEVCVCSSDGTVDCDPASCFVCDEDSGGYPEGTVLDVYGVACVCAASGVGECGTDCLYEGAHVPSGTTISTDDCGTCTCSTGRISCDGCTEPEPEVEPESEPEGEPDGAVCTAPVSCDTPAPTCAADEIPSVIAGCYGPCVYWSECVEVDFGCYPPPGEFCDAEPPACDPLTEVVTYRASCYGPCVPEAFCPDG